MLLLPIFVPTSNPVADYYLPHAVMKAPEFLDQTDASDNLKLLGFLLILQVAILLV
jgi:hypothetical protein|tara:strand:- start:1172 stop:1339 length:168 start_codon:yes stop_codon:yes gene_type:complete